MTCIVGLIYDDKVYIGGDSAGVSGLDVQVRADEKVFLKDNMIFGFTSSFRMGQLIRYKFQVPEQSVKKDDYHYMCTDFIDGLRECFKNGGYSKVDSNREEGGTFLVGYKGQLYCIYDDFQVAKPTEDYDSCGCGAKYALGALRILRKDITLKPKQMITKALETAEFFSGGVSAPFNIVEV